MPWGPWNDGIEGGLGTIAYFMNGRTLRSITFSWEPLSTKATKIEWLFKNSRKYNGATYGDSSSGRNEWITLTKGITAIDNERERRASERDNKRVEVWKIRKMGERGAGDEFSAGGRWQVLNL